MLTTGRLEVFKNKNGYYTAVIKAWDSENNLKGKAFMNVELPEGTTCEDGQTLTLDVKEGYLNAVYVGCDAPFTKLVINIVKAEVVSIYPEPKKAKNSKKNSKEGK
ncbi:MAG: hypothetical protein J6S67_06255 [Methanobrevibacter sp.]|nr:hypothetical protein [Methanobrevibacter sp.]